MRQFIAICIVLLHDRSTTIVRRFIANHVWVDWHLVDHALSSSPLCALCSLLCGLNPYEPSDCKSIDENFCFLFFDYIGANRTVDEQLKCDDHKMKCRNTNLIDNIANKSHRGDWEMLCANRICTNSPITIEFCCSHGWSFRSRWRTVEKCKLNVYSNENVCAPCGNSLILNSHSKIKRNSTKIVFISRFLLLLKC